MHPVDQVNVTNVVEGRLNRLVLALDVGAVVEEQVSQQVAAVRLPSELGDEHGFLLRFICRARDLVHQFGHPLASLPRRHVAEDCVECVRPKHDGHHLTEVGRLEVAALLEEDGLEPVVDERRRPEACEVMQ